MTRRHPLRFARSYLGALPPPQGIPASKAGFLCPPFMANRGGRISSMKTRYSISNLPDLTQVKKWRGWTDLKYSFTANIAVYRPIPDVKSAVLLGRQQAVSVGIIDDRWRVSMAGCAGTLTGWASPDFPLQVRFPDVSRVAILLICFILFSFSTPKIDLGQSFPPMDLVDFS